MDATVERARWTAGGAALLLVAALGGCTADDGADDARAVRTSASTTEPAPGDVASFCAATLDLEASLSVDLVSVGGIADPVQQAAAYDGWTTAVRQQWHAVEDSAPPEVSGDVETMSTYFYDFLAFGELSDFEDPAYQRAEDVVDGYRLTACGYPLVEATGDEFAYRGFPATVPAGVVGIRVANEGDDLHELVISRIDEGVAMSFAEVLALPEDQASSMTTTVGRLFPLAPGAAETTFVRLEPGRYGVSCHLTQGTTQVSEGSGPPHHSLGMIGEFTVA